MPQNVITVHPFTHDALIDTICREAIDRGEEVPEQVRYLARYAERLGARTYVVEGHYVDRHYVDEFAFYYSRMLSPPPNTVRRIHLFAHEFTEAAFADMLAESLQSEDTRKAVEKRLVAPVAGSDIGGYLGFSSIRPLSSVPVGRTVLSRLPDSDGGIPRHIWATNEHFVHLGCLRLRVEGLAFQQQDAAVGACATAALWSALVRVARQEGMRAPTPAEISDAALRSPRVMGRLLPANTGLTVQQLCDATRTFGFTPEVTYAFTRPEAFVATLHTYLLSGIPMVLALRGDGGGHAVTAVGFQMSGSEHPALQTSVPVRSSRLTKLYVHDDRLGPYARAMIEPYSYRNKKKKVSFEGLSFEIEFDGIGAERWLIDTAIAPVYPKLRLPVASLISLAEFKAKIVEDMVGPKKALALRVDFRYERAGDYLTKLAGRVPDPKRAALFVREVALSRWCAIVRWYLADNEIVEFVYDTTDVVRDVRVQARELLRGVVCLNRRYARSVATIGTALRVTTA
jgi:hypothetical protein